MRSERTRTRLDRWLAPRLSLVVATVWRRAARVVLLVALITVSAGVYAAATLRIQSDNVQLVSEGLPFRRAFEELTRHLPVLNRSLVVLVESATPAAARDAADALAAALVGEPGIHDVFQPGGGPFFRRHGLLYRDLGDLESLGDRLSRLQPLLAQMSREARIGPLAAWSTEMLERGGRAPPAPDLWVDLFQRLESATAAAREGRRAPADWSQLAGDGVGGRGRFSAIFVEPRADYRRMAAAGEAMETIRRVAGQVAAADGSRVRITGYPALAYEEARGLLQDATGAGLASLALAALFLRMALRSWRLVVAGTLTLAVGLVWTAGFAALAIGSLNIVSVFFAVLFIGLGVDFAIHLGVRYLDGREAGLAEREAVQSAVERSGGALALCAATTAIGFYSFVPTDYKGVAELGLIAGTGMLIILGLSFTLLPALLALGLRPERVSPRTPASGARRLSALLRARGGWIVAGGAALGLLALLALPRVRFDANVIELRDPDTESVQAFRDLLAEPGLGSPWFIDILAADASAAERVADRLRPLPYVDRVLTPADWVPDQQQAKLEVLQDASFFLDDTGIVADPDAPGAVPALRDLRALLRARGAAFEDADLRRAALDLAEELDRFLASAAADEQRLALLRTNLIGDLPGRLDDLREVLGARAFGVEDLPSGLLERVRTPDGRVRVQVYPAEDLSDPAAWARFADGVREIEPGATGLSINLLEFGRVTMDSLRQAFATALVAIALLLWALGHGAQLAFVMVPLLWAGAATAAATVVLGIELNFVNVVVLPLLLGIGVDSAIHLALRFRESGDGDVLTTSTARAVGYSALTTAASFGTLAVSSHRGVASLGVLLVVGLACTLVSNLVLLPACLARWARPGRSGRAGRAAFRGGRPPTWPAGSGRPPRKGPG